MASCRLQLTSEGDFDVCVHRGYHRRMIEKDDLHLAAIRCGLSEAIEVIGERWAFLILRGAFNGLDHFEQFQAGLGIARNILSDRLARLTQHGILERRPCADDRRRVEYRLTEKGVALLPALLALRQWGERWGSSGPNNPVLVDARDRRPVRQIAVLSEDGRPLELGELRWADRDNLDQTPWPAGVDRRLEAARS